MEAMKEDKPPPDCSRRTKKSDVSQGAAYPCTAKAVASIATAALSCTYCGWRGRRMGGWTPWRRKLFGMKTRTTPTSTTLILMSRMLQVCCRCSLLCMDLRMIRSPPTMLVPRRGVPIKTIPNQKSSQIKSRHGDLNRRRPGWLGT